MSEETYPIQWVDLSPEDDQTVKKYYGELGHCRDLVRSEPELIRVGASIRQHFMKLFTMKIRPDDVWIVTHPKCGTTWTRDYRLCKSRTQPLSECIQTRSLCEHWLSTEPP